MKIERTRRLTWDSCYNTRDIGGFKLGDGRETRWRAVIRSDNLCRLTHAGRASLVEYGVRTVIDVRAPSELLVDPPPFAMPDPRIGVACLNLPFFTDDDLAASPANDTQPAAEIYVLMLHRFAPRVATIMTGVARAEEGGVLVHCLAGKDRTGLIVALLLSLVGVPDDVIAADYALSSEYLRPDTEAGSPVAREIAPNGRSKSRGSRHRRKRWCACSSISPEGTAELRATFSRSV